ncbi:MAG: hypothetical protein ACRENX_03980 [Candidatus Dormibacteria bacterium]
MGAGRGGAGRTTLAMEVAAALSGSARRVLLVDADPVDPDLDVKLGATNLESDGCPGARLDRVLLRLPELVEHRIHLDAVLWASPQTGVRALLAPDPGVEIGREHLDYLFSYLLAPAFDAIVVDAGPALEPSCARSAASVAFWLEVADSVLLPLRPTISSARSAVKGLRLFESMGVPPSRCRLVLGIDRTESTSSALNPRWLRDYAVVRWPWVPQVAREAERDHRPLAACDRKFSQSMDGLLPELATHRRIGS